MAVDTLFTKLFIIFISVPSGDASELKTTFDLQKRQMQQPREDLEVIESLDDDLYEELMNELPIMRQVLVGDRKKNTLRVNESALGRYVSPTGATFISSRRSAPSLGVSPNATKSIGRWRRTIRTMWPHTKKPHRRGFDIMYSIFGYGPWRYKHYQLISCYACGLNETMLPKSRMCHDIFDSDVGVRRLARFFRARCFYYDSKRHYDRIIANRMYFPPFFSYDGARDKGMRMDYFGPYTDGCVKRYVDVGPLYTQRACRGRYQPWRSYYPNHAAHRLSRLEVVARGHSDVCVHSPHASLTPFSRSVSLFVRYHVCVCDTPYCNRSNPHASSHTAPLLILFSIIYYV